MSFIFFFVILFSIPLGSLLLHIPRELTLFSTKQLQLQVTLLDNPGNQP